MNSRFPAPCGPAAWFLALGAAFTGSGARGSSTSQAHPAATSCESFFRQARQALARSPIRSRAANDNLELALWKDAARAQRQTAYVNEYFTLENYHGALIPAGARRIVQDGIGISGFRDKISLIVSAAVQGMLLDLAADWDDLQAVASELGMEMPGFYELEKISEYEDWYDGERFFEHHDPHSTKYSSRFSARSGRLYWSSDPSEFAELRSQRVQALIKRLDVALAAERAGAAPR
jgi:hypothetical protein